MRRDLTEEIHRETDLEPTIWFIKMQPNQS